MDVAYAIDAEAIDVTHISVATAGGAYDALTGKYAKANPASATIRATIQPASGRQLMDLPEGIRAEADFVGWSRTAVVLNDRITTFGNTWRVLYVWPRPADGFTRFAIGRVKP